MLWATHRQFNGINMGLNVNSILSLCFFHSLVREDACCRLCEIVVVVVGTVVIVVKYKNKSSSSLAKSSKNTQTAFKWRKRIDNEINDKNQCFVWRYAIEYFR